MIKQAVDGLSSLYDDIPYWLRTANSTEKVENRPMVRLQNEESLDRYIAYFRRFVCYLLRVYIAKKKREKASEVESGGESGEEEDSKVENNEETIEDEVEEEEEEEDESEAESDDAENLAQPDEDVIVVDLMKDCCELTKFIAEQEWLL